MASGNSHFYQKIFHLLIIAISYTNGYSVPMKSKSFTHLLFWLGFALALQQCTPPTPMERITRNPSLYMAQPKDHQRLIERGELARGIIKCGTLGIVKIGDWIFVHGGILPGLVKHIKNKNINNFISKANVLAKQMFTNMELLNDFDVLFFLNLKDLL
jgi:hypothetical protein